SELKTKIDKSSLSDKQKEILEKLRLEKIENLEEPITITFDEFKENIENIKLLDATKLLDENIDSLDENYLTGDRTKNKLNEIHKLKKDSLIEKFKKEENEKYNSLIEDIKTCEDSYLLSDEYYNEIYRNIEELNEIYLSKDNTKSKLHEIRENRKNILENEDI
ncbi:15871_t:CDS:2, partial [Cetraspora pellucida]